MYNEVKEAYPTPVSQLNTAKPDHILKGSEMAEFVINNIAEELIAETVAHIKNVLSEHLQRKIERTKSEHAQLGISIESMQRIIKDL